MKNLTAKQVRLQLVNLLDNAEPNRELNVSNYFNLRYDIDLSPYFITLLNGVFTYGTKKGLELKTNSISTILDFFLNIYDLSKMQMKQQIIIADEVGKSGNGVFLYVHYTLPLFGRMCETVVVKECKTDTTFEFQETDTDGQTYLIMGNY